MNVELGLFEEYKLSVVAKDHAGNDSSAGRLSVSLDRPDLVAWSFDQSTLTIFSKNVEGVATLTLSSDKLREESIIIRVRGK